MHLRRFTRLTNAHSKTLANMKDAVAFTSRSIISVAFMRSLNKHTPAMRAGLTDHVWRLEELLTGA